MGKRLTPEAAQWREMVAILSRREMAIRKLQPIFREKFSLDCAFYWRDKKSQFDCDNTIKMLADSMIGIVYTSDKLCLPRATDFSYDEKSPRIEFTVSCPPTQLIEILA
jgi:Holliday junction resolvase RusA-like endonuclease